MEQKIKDIIRQQKSPLCLFFDDDRAFYAKCCRQLTDHLAREKRILEFENPNRVKVTYEYDITASQNPLGTNKDDVVFLFLPDKRKSWMKIKAGERRLTIADGAKIRSVLFDVVKTDLANLMKEAEYKGTEEELWKEIWEDRRSIPCFIYTEQIKDLMATGGILEISFYDFLDVDESVKNRWIKLFDEKHYVYKYPLMAKGNSWLYVKSPSRFDVTVTNNGGDAVKPNQHNDPEIQSYTIFGSQTKDELEIKIGVKVPGTLKLWYRALGCLGYAFIAVFLGVALKAYLSEASQDGFSIVYAQVGICIIAAIIATRGWLMNEETVLGKLSKRLTWIAIIIVVLLVGVYSWFMLMK